MWSFKSIIYFTSNQATPPSFEKGRGVGGVGQVQSIFIDKTKNYKLNIFIKMDDLNH